MATPNILVSCASGIAETKHITGIEKSGLREKTWMLGGGNIIKEPLVEQEKIILPPLHIKLGFMKQFIKAIHKNGSCFAYIMQEKYRKN